MMKSNVWIVAVACAVVAGCGGPHKTAATTTSTTEPSATGSQAKAQGHSTLTKLGITDVKVGDGVVMGFKHPNNPSAEIGDLLEMEYTGKLSDGKVFDSNVPGKGKHDIPLPVILGRTEVIPGWTKGLIGMKVGGERKLAIPPSLGYGDQDVPGIPPRSDLYFDVKLLDLVKKGEEGIFDSKDIKVGTGPKAQKGSTVTIEYTGMFPNGTVFDTNVGAGKAPIAVKLGAGMVISGLDSGLMGIQQGGERMLRIPPLIAYGTKLVRGIPPNSVLIFKVKALDVSS